MEVDELHHVLKLHEEIHKKHEENASLRNDKIATQREYIELLLETVALLESLHDMQNIKIAQLTAMNDLRSNISEGLKENNVLLMWRVKLFEETVTLYQKERAQLIQEIDSLQLAITK